MNLIKPWLFVEEKKEKISKMYSFRTRHFEKKKTMSQYLEKLYILIRFHSILFPNYQRALRESFFWISFALQIIHHILYFLKKKYIYNDGLWINQNQSVPRMTVPDSPLLHFFTVFFQIFSKYYKYWPFYSREIDHIEVEILYILSI